MSVFPNVMTRVPQNIFIICCRNIAVKNWPTIITNTLLKALFYERLESRSLTTHRRYKSFEHKLQRAMIRLRVSDILAHTCERKCGTKLGISYMDSRFRGIYFYFYWNSCFLHKWLLLSRVIYSLHKGI
jgi:hypothetical protein